MPASRQARHVAKVKAARVRKDLEERGRGFSINQVQNGGAGILDWSARFFVSAPETGLSRESPLIGTAVGCPAGSFTSRVRTNMTTIAFIP
jgi:hypothetical protein